MDDIYLKYNLKYWISVLMAVRTLELGRYHECLFWVKRCEVYNTILESIEYP